MFFFISTIINKNNNKLALKNVCHFHSSEISPTEFVDGSVYVNLDVRRVDYKLGLERIPVYPVNYPLNCASGSNSVHPDTRLIMHMRKTNTCKQNTC